MNFRIEDSLPDYYVSKSRDFQLMCRIADIYLRGCYNRACNMLYQMDINKCNESLLYGIAYMQGFTTSMYIPPDVLRSILKVFPWCIKRKGTSEAIEVASYAIMATYKYIYNIEVQIGNSSNDYAVRVSIAGKDEYIDYIYEVLKFLVPAGYNIQVYNVHIYNTSLDDREAIEDYVSRVSGISGVIMSSKPIDYDPKEPEVTSLGYYSKIGYAKIIRAGSKENLFSQTFGNQEKLLLDETTKKPVFIYGKT